MHPFHAEILARSELEQRHRDAAERRQRSALGLAWPDRTGALLVTLGERFARAGHRLQTSRRGPDARCLQAC